MQKEENTTQDAENKLGQLNFRFLIWPRAIYGKPFMIVVLQKAHDWLQ